jgi:hypothetical protein
MITQLNDGLSSFCIVGVVLEPCRCDCHRPVRRECDSETGPAA